MAKIAHRTVQTNGISMRIAEAGEGPLVLMCHGFPESWYSWRYQLQAMGDAGYHAVAPDMRGYNRSEKPPGVAAYAVDLLVEEMHALIRHFGAERATVVGYDWGGGVAWGVAIRRP